MYENVFVDNGDKDNDKPYTTDRIPNAKSSMQS